ncbi:serine/threonine-protein kinase Nek11 [Xenopus tropicalis]|uniref:Serine/threonine-protein kinase Nek11 n=1 Tax=Xenopus tropicalis TaxID=8364 RepID=Q0V999_XENTR|nr:serine/threonine-protein kinase Nek11 [Xenopus tropicalis]AAI21686.1 NIMA (never in mitosis gene a)-related expressed kinase 11 [Xenopus tropicalis]|eukprot:NP_001072436.1 serine/threonine-protein kinase Nek11 [Xenopus tropicalis]
MPNIQECERMCHAGPLSACTDTLIAKRYLLQQRLGKGSFGTVYLVIDKKAKDEQESLKVLKEIPVGELNPNETVQANVEAQLLSKLDHPAIVKFHASFLENESFCIITEYCEGRDLDFKVRECKKNEEKIAENQVVEWFIQLLLGVNYMHVRRILHRDLKAKNIFLKNNLLKIGDFGVSRLLMGSCDLATTFTGTPYYMSPEALKHQGYDSKSDIWSLGCILHEMCCLEHAFIGYNFLSVVISIVEGETPSLPDCYSSSLNLIMNRMLNKDPALRPSAGEILQDPFINEQLKQVKWEVYGAEVKDKTTICKKEADQIRNVVQRKFHLQTLRELSEVQKMTPRERMRLRKLNAADEKARRLKQLAEEKYQENHKRMQELRSRNFQLHSIDVLHVQQDDTSNHLIQSEPMSARHYTPQSYEDESEDIQDRLCASEPSREIPEDPCVADAYYEDGFDSCSEESDECVEEEDEYDSGSQITYQQDSDVKAMVLHLEDVLASSCFDTDAATNMSPPIPLRSRAINDTMAQTKLKRMRESAVQSMGKKSFDKVYSYLKSARQNKTSEKEVKKQLESMVSKPSECFIVDQLLYFEEELAVISSRTGKA